MQTVLADFIQMGQAQVGTQALAQTKAGLFATAMGAFLDSIESVINRHAIPRLLAINGMPLEAPPEFHFDEIEYEDVGQWVEALSKLAGAGMPIFPDPLVENVVRGKLDLPELTEEEIEQRQQEDEAEKQDAKERERLMADAALAAAQNPQGAGKPQEA
jgi:phage gp29-like protein